MAVANTRDKINQTLGQDDPQKHVSTGKRGMKNKKTEKAVKELLKHGTPKWFSHPEDYKEMAKEDYARQKENSDRQVAEYKLENQDVFTDEEPRKVNEMSVMKFLQRLREHGLQCCVKQAPNSPRGTAGLWAIRPGYEKLGLQFVTSVQVPAMYEWSVLRVDEHGLAAGEKFIGWRNACVRLVELGIWSEEKVNLIFGRPPLRKHTSVYHQSMWNLRNGRTVAGQVIEHGKQ